MKNSLFLPWMLSTASAFSLWKGDRGQNHPRISSLSASVGPNNNSNNNGMETSSFEFNGRLRKAYQEWSETYGDSIDESRMEVFSYHFVMAENYFQETGNRINLNEYADLTAVEFQRLKEMGGMIQDADGETNSVPHWAPEDVAQMDFFAKQTSQRQQAFQDSTKNKVPELPQPPPGYFSVLAPSEGDSKPQTASYREAYQQRFTQSYLDSLDNQATEAQDVSPGQIPQVAPPPQEQQPSDMYMFNDENDNNNNRKEDQANNYAEAQQSFQEAEKPELQDLINSRYGGIGFLEDSAMVGNGAMDYKFFPALSKMYNLDYPEQSQMDGPPPPQRMEPPPPQEFAPPPPQELAEQEKRETFMNAMSTLYAQMFGEEGGPPDQDTFRMMEQIMMNGGGPPPPMGFAPPPEHRNMPPRGGEWGSPSQQHQEGSWGGTPAPPRRDEKRPVEPNMHQQEQQQQPEEEEIGTDVLLGELSYSMTRGRVIEWLKNIGDRVQQGEPLCVVESDTYTMVDGQKYAETHDVVALEDGILAAMYADVAETVPVGSILGVVAADMEEASRVPQTMDQERLDFVEAPTAKKEDEEVFFDENGYPVDEEGFLLETVPVDEDGYPIGEYVDGYPVDEDGYIIEDEYSADEEGFITDDGYDENGYPIDEYGAEEEGGGGAMYDEHNTHGEGFGEEAAYTGPVDDDPDLPSWVLGNAPSIAPAKVASKYPVVPKMDRPQPATPAPKPKVAARRPAPKRTPPKGRPVPRGANRTNGATPKRPRGRIDDVRSPARKRGAPPKPKLEGTEIKLSELAYGMTKGTVIEWIKNVGDPVKKGEPLAVVESDTFMMIDGQKYAESHDVEASQDGILAAVYTGVKQTMPVGSLLGVIADNEAAARSVPQSNPFESAVSDDAYEQQDTIPLSRTQRAAAAAAQASADPVNRARASPESGFIDSVEQVEEDVLQSTVDQQSDDEFDRRFMTPQELENADFAAAGSVGGGGGGGAPAATPLTNDDRDLPSWVLGNAPSIAPAKVASKFPVVPKISQPSVNSPSMNAINAARDAAMQNEQTNSNVPPPARQRSPPPPQKQAPTRRAAPPKRRSAPPKRREDSGRGRIDNIRAPLNQPEEDEGTEIVLSALSYGMKKAMIIEWLKNVGDPVKKGEPLAVVESDTFMVIDTQKYAESHDIVASQDGFLAAQYGGPKELFEVGAVLGVIAETAAAARNVRNSADPPRSRAQPNGAGASATFYPEQSNVPGETYIPPPDEGAASTDPAWADDPDLPSWVLGNAPSIAPAKVASKYPVVPNMRRGTPAPTPAAAQSPASGVVNGSTGTQRRIPKGRYDDTRARPKQIRVEDKTTRTRPRGRIDDIRAPLTHHSSGASGGRSSQSRPGPQAFSNLSNTNGSRDATSKHETEEPIYMPDLSGSASTSDATQDDSSDVPSEDDPPEPVAEDGTNAGIPTTKEEPPEIPDDVSVAEGDLVDEAVATKGENFSVDSQGNVEAEDKTVSEISESLEEVDANGAEHAEVDVDTEIIPEDIELEFEEEIMNGEVTEDVAIESDANVTAAASRRLPEDPKRSEPPKKQSPTAKKVLPEINVQEAVTNSTETMVQEILVTAKARTAAEEAKIDLTAIQGTGESGCITLDDVKLAIARKKPKIGIRFLTDKPKTRNSSQKEKSNKEGP